MTEGEYKQIITLLRRGGYCGGKITKANERIAFVAILIAITGFSLEQVLRLNFTDFVLEEEKCFLNYQTPRAGHPKKIKYPQELHQYLHDYKEKYFMYGQDKIFYLNSGYVLRRILSAQEEVTGNSGICEIREFVKYRKNTKVFEKKVTEYLMLEDVSPIHSEHRFNCTKSTRLVKNIEHYTKQMM